MIGKLIMFPFHLVGGSASLVGSLLKFVFTIILGLTKFLFKNFIGVIIGVIGGFFIARKAMESEAEECNCTCESKNETPVEG